MTTLEIITKALLIAGTFFCLVAAIGILRLPDVFLRIHAASKASTLGMILLALATALKFFHTGGGRVVAAKSALMILFLMLTAPVAAHLMGRAAKRKKNPMSPKTTLDEWDVQDPAARG